MMKYILAIIISAMMTSLNAETLSFPSFQIEIQDGWEHTIETGPGDNWGSVISLSHPNGVGSLKILPYDAPAVSQDRLRNLTNVELSVRLTWQNWGTILVISMIIWKGVHSIDSGGLRTNGQSYSSPISVILSQRILKPKRSTILFDQ